MHVRRAIDQLGESLGLGLVVRRGGHDCGDTGMSLDLRQPALGLDDVRLLEYQNGAGRQQLVQVGQQRLAEPDSDVGDVRSGAAVRCAR